MLAERKYYDDYDYYRDSTVRKKQYDYDIKPSQKVSSNKKLELNKKAKTSTVLSILFIFSLSMILVYRFNIISEKNFQVQTLQKQLDKIQANETKSQIAVEQSTDLNSIEAYAKQKLGMQKPGKNQIIYVDNSIKDSVQSSDQKSIIDKIVSEAKKIIKQIF